MRLTSGVYRGMEIHTAKGFETRPTGVKARQALWNILQQEVVGAKVMDLFAGSGAIGLEALSRGASQAIFVESARESQLALQKNMDEIRRRAVAGGHTPPQTALLKRDIEKVWGEMDKFKPFDIIWADPPYRDAVKWWPMLAKELAPLLGPGGIFAVECDKAGVQPLIDVFDQDPNWSKFKQKAYGICWINIYRKNNQE